MADAQPTNPALPVERLRTLIDEELVPLLPGVKVSDGTRPATTGQGLVFKRDDRTIQVRSREEDPDLLELTRIQPFADDELRLITEQMRAIGTISPYRGQFYYEYAVASAIRHGIVRFLDYPNEELLLKVLSEFELLASQTYEGHRIAAAIGLDDVRRNEGIRLDEVWEEDFGKVLTGGIETMMTVSADGYLWQYRRLYSDAKLGQAPHYSRMVAEWSQGRRLTIMLNRNGEILLFRNQALAFAWRRGRWRHFAHASILSQMVTIDDVELRTHIYETCLDVSFGRSGGCIGVVLDGHKRKLRGLVNKDDRIEVGASTKSRVLTKFLDQPEYKRKFTLLPRPLRQAMAAIDGALVLDHRGIVLAAGAILKVDSGSDAGARKAAAKAIARLGFGTKISADGGVAGFYWNPTSDRVEEAFEFG